MQISSSVLPLCLYFASSMAVVHHGSSYLPSPRDLVFDPLESVANSVLGMSTAASQQSTTEIQSTQQTQTTAEQVSSSVTQRVVTITRAAASTSPSATETSSKDTSSTTGDRTAVATSSSRGSSTSGAAASSTTSSESSVSTSAATSATISSSLTSNTANPLQDLPTTSGAAAQPKVDDGTRVSPAGIAVGVLFSAIIVACTVFLVYKTCPSAKNKFVLWRRHNKISEDPYKKSGKGGDEEQGMVEGMGLGLGEVAKLRQVPDMPLSKQYDQAHAKISMDSNSGESVVSDISTPPSVIYHHRERSLPSISGLRSHVNVSPVSASAATRRTTTPVPYGPNNSQNYTPYRSVEDLSMGLTMPQQPPAYKGLPPLPPPPGTMKVLPSYGRAKRISGIHELS